MQDKIDIQIIPTSSCKIAKKSFTTIICVSSSIIDIDDELSDLNSFEIVMFLRLS